MRDKEQERSVEAWFYDPSTGLFTGRCYRGPRKALRLNVPDGCECAEGHYDPLSQRVDVDSGAVVDYRPPKPDDDHEWDDERKRWQLRPEVVLLRRNREMAFQRIDELERRQLRPARELAIDPSDEAAARRLREIEKEIQALRADL